MEIIPTLDLQNFHSGTKKKKLFIQELKKALEGKGFFFLKNHQISENTLSTAKKVFNTFFEFPEEVRKLYEYVDEQHQRGYTPMRIEKGEFASIADEKHFFQIGADRNVVVTEIPEFKATADMLFAEFQRTAKTLLGAISLSLGLEESYLPSKEGNSIMRAIDYPPTDTPLIDDGLAAKGGNFIGMCASKHTDINMITLLEAKEEGLQLANGEQWLPITINDPKLIIVNAGDMLEHLTGGRYKSGLHRVVCKRNIRRFSIPFFCHVNKDESLVPLKHLGESDLTKYPFKTAGEYLNHRLAQIGL